MNLDALRGGPKDERRTNRMRKVIPEANRPIVRKIPASSVTYGESISRNGKYVWVGEENGRVVVVAATAAEARRKVYELRRQTEGRAGQKLTGDAP